MTTEANTDTLADIQADASVRPTKKQRELLSFIQGFINEHGYSPSYREIMNGLNYTSVATVSLHVNNLIRRGHLRKRDRSARSLEVVNEAVQSAIMPVVSKSSEGAWLIEKVEDFFRAVEATPVVSQHALDELHVLVGSLKVLGFDEAAADFVTRLDPLQAPSNASA